MLGTFTKPMSLADHSLKLSHEACSDRPWKTLTIIPCHHGQKKFMSMFSVNVRNDYENSNVDDVIRSSSNFEPNQWDYSSFQSIDNNCTEEKYGASS